MTRPVRLGAVSYLNVRPLVYVLEQDPGVSLRFDVPAECARLLETGAIDLGMVPSITYPDRECDRIVPGLCIGSVGPVASVALFARRPMREVRSIALDTSSRTSAALVRILCRRRFRIAPAFVPLAPDLTSMLAAADAALLIGDQALFADYHAAGATKIDLGAEWTALTGLPFVWAFWAGRSGAADPAIVGRLQAAAREGMSRVDEIAAAYCAAHPQDTDLAARYLRDNLVFELDAPAIEGLRAFYREGAAAGVIQGVRDVAFFDGG